MGKYCAPVFSLLTYQHFTSANEFIMKIAYIILAHRYPEQLIRFVLRLNNDNVSFFIHIDKKASNEVFYQIQNDLHSIKHIYFLKRYRCFWGDFNIVKATLEGIKGVVKAGIDFDYVILLSGQDYLIKPISQLENFLKNNEGKEFMEFFALDSRNKWTDQGGYFQAFKRIDSWHFRFRSKHLCLNRKRQFPIGLEPYGGTQWWCLSKQCIEYINNFIIQNNAFVNYFKYVFIPDEVFFQTIILNSPFKDNVINDDLRYVDWENPNPNVPAILSETDWTTIINSSKFFARKFDITRDPKILDMIDQNILNADK